MSAKEILQSIINDFDILKFENFFREKNNKLKFPNENLHINASDDFSDGKKIAEAQFEDGEFIICSLLVKKELTERSGKKSQYEIGKRILKQQQADAGIFIFYDSKGDFRFSLIYTNYLGKRRDWSNFKRFTYFVSKDQTNKTFLKQIGDSDLSSIEKIKEAFSVEKVTKEFYNEIQSWYFWAIQHSKFPKDAEKEKNGRNESIIRLITRMIFIWFMREKELVPKKLFEQKNIEEILKSVEPNNSTYYLAILQNLFFATLNTKKEERRFRNESRYYKGWNEDFGNQYVYRYHNLFKNPEKIKEYFGDIPFLNGGLFDCLDNGKDDIYIDGFTEGKKEYQPQIPNFLFFGEETEIDLNAELGTKNKKYKARGLLNILSSFNFTIDENSLDDIDIALDPELLGRVFENLLASYNPETATTARKATGSYYTPREIVDYMVTESLKEYLKTHLSKIENIDDKLEKLFSIEITENPFNKLESEQLVKLIESIRILDPAVGSGAFPMGVLNKMVFILHKVDPDNKLWKQKQLEAVDTIPDPQLKRNTKEQIEKFFNDKSDDYGRKLYLIQKCIYGVDIQQIAVEITKLRFFISLLVDEKIDKTKENYGIKPLPNLGFKIMQGNSLIEIISYTSTNDHKRNKIVNQLKKLKDELFGIASPKEKNKKRDEVDNLNKQIFEYDKNLIIDGLKQEIKNIQNQGRLFKDAKFEAENKKRIEELKNKIEEVRKTKISDPSEHFEWHINFSEVFQEKGGFDIVIANPPYIRQEKIKDQKPILEKQNYEVFNSTSDIYTYFYEKGYQLLKPEGILCFISSNKWLRAKYGEKLRKFLKEKTTIKQIIDFNGYKVFEATVDTNIILFQKTKPLDNIIYVLNIQPDFTPSTNIIDYFKEHKLEIKQSALDINCFTFGDELVLNLKKKIEQIGTPLKNWDVKIYRGILTGLNEAFIIDSAKREEILNNCQDDDEKKRTEAIIKPILRGRDIYRYGYQWAGLWVIGTFPSLRLNIDDYPTIKKYFLDNFDVRQLEQSGKKYPELGFDARKKTGNKWFETQDNIAYYSEFEKEKIVWAETAQEIKMAYIPAGFYLQKTCFMITGKNLKYIQAIANSFLFDWYTKRSVYRLGEKGVYLSGYFMEQLPIPKISTSDQQAFINLVDKILTITKEKDYLEKPEKQAKVKEYENQIDELVYKLYNLTDEEIEIIEKNT